MDAGLQNKFLFIIINNIKEWVINVSKILHIHNINKSHNN
jgi:hypothetical protein